MTAAQASANATVAALEGRLASARIELKKQSAAMFSLEDTVRKVSEYLHSYTNWV